MVRDFTLPQHFGSAGDPPSDIMFSEREVEGRGVGIPESGRMLVWMREGAGVAGGCGVVLEDWQRMAEAEGGSIQVEIADGGLGEREEAGIFALPIEEELEYLPRRGRAGQRAIFKGNRAAHIGEEWDWVSWGDSAYDGEAAYPAVVTGPGEENRECYVLPGRSSNEGEAYAAVAQLAAQGRKAARKGSVGSDSKVCEALFRAVSTGKASSMCGRDMSPYSPVLQRIMGDDQGFRAFIRQTGHSLSPGVQIADAAGRGGKREIARGWECGYGGVKPLVPGIRGEGGVRAKLKRRVAEILKGRLAGRAWSGWAVRESQKLCPDVLDNWRIRHWECRQAERLAIKRNLDGAARAHFRGGDVPACPAGCPGCKDEQEHWLLVCRGLEGVRNKGWKLVEEEVGDWVRELSVVEQHLLMAGRIPRHPVTGGGWGGAVVFEGDSDHHHCTPMQWCSGPRTPKCSQNAVVQW